MIVSSAPKKNEVSQKFSKEFRLKPYAGCRELAGPREYLFPNPDNPSGFQASFKKVRATTLRKAGVDYFRIYIFFGPTLLG